MGDIATITELNDENKPESYVDFDSIIEVIQTTIEPYSWQDTGDGEGTISGFESTKLTVLVVTQPPEVHRKLESFIAKLRKLHQSKKNVKPSNEEERRHNRRCSVLGSGRKLNMPEFITAIAG